MRVCFFFPPVLFFPNLEGLLSNVSMTKNPFLPQSVFLSPRPPLAMAVGKELPPAGGTRMAGRGEPGAGCPVSLGL